MNEHNFANKTNTTTSHSVQHQTNMLIPSYHGNIPEFNLQFNHNKINLVYVNISFSYQFPNIIKIIFCRANKHSKYYSSSSIQYILLICLGRIVQPNNQSLYRLDIKNPAV